MEDLKCPFRRILLPGDFGCSHAHAVTRREGPDIACEAPRTQALCDEVLTPLKAVGEFIYRNLAQITQITATMDTHLTMQVFHAIFFVDKDGNHPAPYTDIHASELRDGRWKFNHALAGQFDVAPEYAQQMMVHYAEELEKKGKYALTVWPYHAMLGGVGHALVSSVEEAVFFHSVARLAQTDIVIKGDTPFTENYSVIGPEVLTDRMGETLGTHNQKFIEQLQQ